MTTKQTFFKKLISLFNLPLLKENDIGLVGGQTISMKTNIFRQSDDLDFACLSNQGFRVLRNILKSPDGINQIIQLSDDLKISTIDMDLSKIKLLIIDNENNATKIELINFTTATELFDMQIGETEEHNNSNEYESYQLNKDSLFFTKLTALTDRWNNYPYKDFFDILTLYYTYGLPNSIIFDSLNDYSNDGYAALLKSLTNSISNKQNYQNAISVLQFDSEFDFDPSYMLLNEINFNLLHDYIDYLDVNKLLYDEQFNLMNKIENLNDYLVNKNNDLFLSDSEKMLLDKLKQVIANNPLNKQHKLTI